jgi:Putative auto-transporter adhesin, head GIN domain
MRLQAVEFACHKVRLHCAWLAAVLFLFYPCFSDAGAEISETREVGQFYGVEFRGYGEVYLTQGGDTELRLVGEESLLKEYESFVDSGILIIKNDSWMKFWRKKPITVYISTPVVTVLSVVGSGAIYGESTIYSDNLKIELAGSGEIELDVTTRVLGTTISGSGEIRLRGTTQKLKHTASGSGNLKGRYLETESSEINISGSGMCELFVTGQLDVLISGSGKIYYRGNPKAVNQEVSGSGKIIKME